ncbi:prepilin-type N-terminal cleavage/methylation domain-containing protein [Arenimonas fontis]|uniref:Prepilin-type N-terminal cleavage/methylation domain-containing protein n=1 Tax=Arenimonas fontis TaxID=2608255 RepID=A0A5B2ZBR5_9GAMM|nr:prepilin-type N-terminal cleavage/methylation domain-containing protein [Arenimonas fontis]KAA2284983.1 prepilin-type N-terminal cleavage/methylation domain-containing protein [Arenimonas fontis]
MSRTRGFSLIEVLLATALLAAGLALAFATLANATRAGERAEAEAQRAERLRAVQGFLRRQLEGALAMPFSQDEGTGEAIVFEAERDRLRFVAPMPGYLSRGGPYLMEFELVPGPDGQRLRFQHYLLTPEGVIEPEREPEVLLEGLRDAAFSVRALDAEGGPGPWSSRWDQPGRVPALVRLEARFADPAARWPTLVAAPRLGLAPLGGLGDAAGLPPGGRGR